MQDGYLHTLIHSLALFWFSSLKLFFYFHFLFFFFFSFFFFEFLLCFFLFLISPLYFKSKKESICTERLEVQRKKESLKRTKKKKKKKKKIVRSWKALYLLKCVLSTITWVFMEARRLLSHNSLSIVLSFAI